MESVRAFWLRPTAQGPHAPSPLRASSQSDHLSFRALLRQLYNSQSHQERNNLSPQALLLSTHAQFNMERLARLLSCVLLAILPLAAALKFDLHPVAAHDSARYERCIRNFVAREQLVVVTAILDGYRGDGQRVDMHVRCKHPIQHRHITRIRRCPTDMSGIDPRCNGQRLPPSQRCSRREPLRFHLARRLRL
jgi:hypothetical protein